ncbi:MAG: protein kinase [Planctomycetaceae bacterium]|nr:protein kinase [Planctomycetaceae bacterium]
MSLPNSDHTQDANRSFDSDDAAEIEHDNRTIIENSVEAVNQESQQTLDSQCLVSNPSIPSSSYANQSNVGTLDSRNLDSNQSAPSAGAAGQTCLETPGSAEFLKTGDRSNVPDPAPSANRPSRAAHGAERYVLVENFAHGGLGNLWRAEDTAIRREVAFKELLPRALKNPVQVERFIEEAQISGQLEHPGIIPIYDVGFQENGTPYYAMKLVRGGNMEVAIEAMHKLPKGSPERQLAFNRLLRQFIAICQAVGFAHDKGVLHRDLKPLNVMLGEFGETLVLDWGLAKLVDLIGEQMISSDRSSRMTPDGEQFVDDGQSEVATIVTNESQHSGATKESVSKFLPSSSNSEVTQANTARSFTAKSLGPAKAETRVAGNRTYHASTATATGQRPVQTGIRSAGSETLTGQVMGTPAYMSPEQALGQIDELDARTDIYSLGAILYKLLSNQQPVGRGKVQEVLDKVIAGLIPPPRTIDPTIPKPLEAICLKAMAKDMTARYPKALDVATDVEAYLADQPVSAYPDPWLERVRRWSKQHSTLVTTSFWTLFVTIIVGLLWQWSVTHRINGVRDDARAKVDDARSAIKDNDYVKATELLETALARVQVEPKLDSERVGLQIQLDDLKRLQEAAENERLTNIQNKVKLDLAEVQHAINDNQDFTQAKSILNRVVGQLDSENSLAELHQLAHTQLEAVNQFENFGKEVEQARIFGGNISGDESLDDIRESKRHALDALKIFEIDVEQPDKAGPRLRSLGDKSMAKWRDGMQEVLVTLAYLETKLAIRDDPDDLQKAAQRSLDHLQQGERLGFSSQPMWFLRADLFGLLKQPDEAQAARQTAETLTPKTRLDHYLLGEFKRGQGKYKEALSHFEDALLADPNDFWSLNMLGLCHFQLGQYEAVIPSCTACIARRPSFDWPYLARGVAFGKLKQFAKAHQDIAKSLELKPQSYHAYLNRGVIHVYQKNYEAATADFEQASQLKPDQAAPFINLAATGLERANELLNDSQKPNASVLANAELQLANVALTSAIERSPQQAAIYSFRGKIRMAQNNVTAALEDFAKANKLEFAPLRRAENFQQIGNIRFRSRQLEAALTAYDLSLESNPNDSTTIRQRAETMLALKRYDEAVLGFTAVLEKAGPIADVYRGRSVAFAALNKHREAINDYTMSLQYEPAPNMLAQRGWAYLLESAKLAKEDFEEAVRLNPEDPAFYQGLAYATVILGDHASAVAVIEKTSANTTRVVGQLGPKSWQYLFNPATVYSQAHDKALTDVKLAPERRVELAHQYSKKGVELLIQAHQLAGPQLQPRFLNALRTDPALDPIRQRPEYLEALKTLDPESAAKLERKKSDARQKP